MKFNPEDMDMTPAGIFYRMESRCSYFLQAGTEHQEDWLIELHHKTKELNAIIAQMKTVTQADADSISKLISEIDGKGTGWWDYRIHVQQWFKVQGFEVRYRP